MKTNVQKVKAVAKAMDGNPYVQMVVMTALGNYCNAALKMTDEQWNKNGDGNMLSLAGWKQGCKMVLEVLDKE